MYACASKSTAYSLILNHICLFPFPSVTSEITPESLETLNLLADRLPLITCEISYDYWAFGKSHEERTRPRGTRDRGEGPGLTALVSNTSSSLSFCETIHR